MPDFTAETQRRGEKQALEKSRRMDRRYLNRIAFAVFS